MTDKTSENVKRSPLGSFLYHQGRALEETGRAFAALLPKDFRTHAGNAVEESVAGIEVLANVVFDGVEDLIERVRPTSADDDPGKDKVKVDVE
jgi:hypothetical protein